MDVFEGIIDVYEGNAPDLGDAWSRGVRAILWETGRGLCSEDSKYSDFKMRALDKGFLWCGYHLMSGDEPTKQVDKFLELEDGSDPRVAMALDWEKCCDGSTLNYAQMREAIQHFNTRMKPRYTDRYPIIYGGWAIRECAQLQAGDSLFAKCPVWYQRYLPAPDGLPTGTWPAYTLWQYDDENRTNGAPPSFACRPGEDKVQILQGADWNRFPGTFEQLRAAWPFVGPVAAV
jgi:lysozyme